MPSRTLFVKPKRKSQSLSSRHPTVNYSDIPKRTSPKSNRSITTKAVSIFLSFLLNKMSLQPVKTFLSRLWQTKTGAALAERYKDLAGYRQIGLLGDDLISEEDETVQKALRRLPPRAQYDRVYRLRRAMQCSLSQTILPPHEQTKPDQDVPYLQPYIKELLREDQERRELDAITKAQ